MNQTEIVENKAFFRPISVVKSDIFLTNMRAFGGKKSDFILKVKKNKVKQVRKFYLDIDRVSKKALMIIEYGRRMFIQFIGNTGRQTCQIVVI